LPFGILANIMKVFVVILKGANTAFLPCYGNNWAQLQNLNVIAAQSLVLNQYYCSRYDEAEIRKIWSDGVFQTANNYPNKNPSWIEVLKNKGWTTDYIGVENKSDNNFFASIFNGRVFLEPQNLKALDFHQEMIALNGFKNKNQNSLIWVEVSSLLPPWNSAKEFLDPIQEELQDYFLGREEVEEDEEFPVTILNPIEGFQSIDDKTFLALSSGCALAWTAVDDMLGAMVASIQEKYGENEFSVVITSDRGSGTCQHEVLGTNPDWLFREFSHLPFLLYQPNLGKGGQRRDGYFQDVDLAPTLADICGLSVDGFFGKSILQTDFLEDSPRRFAYTQDSRTGSKVFRTPSRAFFYRPSGNEGGESLTKYFVIPDDILEINDISKTEIDYQEKIVESILMLDQEGFFAQKKIEALLDLN
jgi:hypothetical protein